MAFDFRGPEGNREVDVQTRTFIPVVVIFATLAGVGHAQAVASSADPRGSGQGRDALDIAVVDAAGGPVPSATVEIASDALKVRVAVTDAEGRATVAGLPAGAYRITVSRAGFAPSSQTIAHGGAEQATAITIALSVATAESVFVTALAPDRLTTASRIELPVRDLPQSIQSIPARLLTEQAAVRVADAITNISGVVRANGFGNTTDEFFMRGFRINNIYKDGFATRVFSGFVDVAGIERIEALKGPSSALYGQAEPGGIVNVISKRPLFTPQVAVDVQGGSNAFLRTTVDATGPLSATRRVAGRMIAAVERSGSFRDFIDTRRLFVAPSVRMVSSGGATFTAFGEYLRQDRPVDAGLPVSGRSAIDVPVSRSAGEDFEYGQYRTFFGGGAATLRLPAAWTLQTTARYFDVDDRSRYVFPFLGSDGRTADRYAFEPISETASTEVNADFIRQTAARGLTQTWLAGVEWRRLRNRFVNRFATMPAIDLFAPIYGAPVPEFPEYEEEPEDGTTATGVYAQGLIDLPWRTKVLGGIRVDRIHDRVEQQTDAAASPRLGVVVQPTRSVAVHGSYNRAFVPVVGRTFDGVPFVPERSEQIEAGIKLGAASAPWAATLAVFQLTRRNVRTADPDHVGESIQVGEQRSRGIEADFMGDLSRGFSVTVAYALTVADVTRDNTIAVGSLLPNVPRHGGRLWVAYRLSDGPAAGLGLGGGVVAQSAKQGDARNRFDVPRWSRVDATVFFERARWRLGLNGVNLTNTRYFEVGGVNVLLPGAPRQVMTTFGLRF